MALAFTTGSAPGRPKQTGQVCSLSAAPNWVESPQNILLRVESWAWISRPITGSYFSPLVLALALLDMRHLPFKFHLLADGLGDAKNRVFREMRTHQLHAH